MGLAERSTAHYDVHQSYIIHFFSLPSPLSSSCHLLLLLYIAIIIIRISFNKNNEDDDAKLAGWLAWIGGLCTCVSFCLRFYYILQPPLRGGIRWSVIRINYIRDIINQSTDWLESGRFLIFKLVCIIMIGCVLSEMAFCRRLIVTLLQVYSLLRMMRAIILSLYYNFNHNLIGNRAFVSIAYWWMIRLPVCL